MSLAMMQWAVANGLALDDECHMAMVAMNLGRTDIADWLLDSGHTRNKYCLFLNAALDGRMDALDWLVDRHGYDFVNDRTPYSSCPIYVICRLGAQVAREGHLGVLQWMHGRGASISWEEVCLNAIAVDNTAILDWIYECDYRPSAEALDFAVGRVCSDRLCVESFPTLDWLLGHGCVLSESARSEIVLAGDLSLVRLLYTHGHIQDRELWIATARRRNRVSIIDWLSKQSDAKPT